MGVPAIPPSVLTAAALSGVGAALRTRQLRIIPFGDSITIGASAEVTPGVWSLSGGWSEGPIFRSGRYRYIRNAGVAGNTVAQALARLQADVLAYSPDVVPILLGTNNLVASMTDAAITSMFSDLETIVRQCLANGALPLIATCPPKTATIAEAKKVQPYYYMLAQAYGLPLVDIYRLLVSPATGGFATGMTSDGTHLTNLAIDLISSTFDDTFAAIGTRAALAGPYLAAVNETAVNGGANMLRNSLFVTQTTPPAPDGWTINTTNATYTTPDAAFPYTGKVFTYDKTVLGGAYALAGATPTLTVGHTYVFSGRVKATGLSPAADSGYSVILQGGTLNCRPMNNWRINGEMTFSVELLAPTGVSAPAPQLFVNDVAAYEASNWTLWDKTAAEAIFTPRP